MSKQSIDIARLREITKKAQKPQIKRNELDEKRKARRIKRETKRIAKEVIEKIPAFLEKEAREGRNHAQVMTDISRPEEKKSAEIVASYCRKQGLQVKILYSVSPSSDSLYGPHDYIVVFW